MTRVIDRRCTDRFERQEPECVGSVERYAREGCLRQGISIGDASGGMRLNLRERAPAGEQSALTEAARKLSLE